MERRDTPNQTRIQPGWDVFDSDHRGLGKVAEATDQYLLIKNSLQFGKDLYLPARVVDHVEGNNRVVLNVPMSEIQKQNMFSMPAEARQPSQTPTTEQQPGFAQPEGTVPQRPPEYTGGPGMGEQRYAGQNELVIRTERFVEERIIRNPTDEERRRFMQEGRVEPRPPEEWSSRESQSQNPPQQGGYSEPQPRQ